MLQCQKIVQVLARDFAVVEVDDGAAGDDVLVAGSVCVDWQTC